MNQTIPQSTTHAQLSVARRSLAQLALVTTFLGSAACSSKSSDANPPIDAFNPIELQTFAGSLPAGWTQAPGALTQIEIGRVQHIWGVNSSGYAYQWSNSKWNKRSSTPKLKQVSVGHDGVVGAVDQAGNVFYWEGSAWKQLPGVLTHISVGDINNVWGVNSAGAVYRFDKVNVKWVKKSSSPAIKYVSIGRDGTVVAVKSNGAAVQWTGSKWGTAGNSPSLRSVSVADSGNIWGVNSSGQAVKRSGSSWNVVSSPTLTQVSVGTDGIAVGVDSSKKVFYYQAGSSTNAPTVSIKSPPADEVVHGLVNITTTVSNNVTSVQFFIDDKLKHTDKSTPFTYKWDTGSKQGTRKIRVVAAASGKSAAHEISVAKISVSPEDIAYGDVNFDYVFDGAVTDMYVAEQTDGSLYPVVYVNTAKLGEVSVASDAPFWWKLYMSGWKNGKHMEDYLPSALLKLKKTYNSFAEWAAEATLGFKPNSQTLGYRGNSNHDKNTWFYDTRVLNEQRSRNGGLPTGNQFFSHHTRLGWGKKSGDSSRFEWVPGTYDFSAISEGGADYHDTKTADHIYVNVKMWIDTYKKIVHAPGTGSYDPVFEWERIIPGETRKDGWGILPQTDDATGKWIFFAPDSEELLMGEGTISPTTIGQREGDVANIWAPNIPIGTFLVSQLQAFHFETAERLHAQDLIMAFGGMDDSDINENGSYDFIFDGYAYRDLKWFQVEALLKAYDIKPDFHLNGSGNTHDGAVEAAGRLSEVNNRPVVLVYMAQDILGGPTGVSYGDAFWNRLNVDAMVRLADLISLADAAGFQYDLSSHSWGGHLVADVLTNYLRPDETSGLGTYFAFNPAHGAFAGANQLWYDYLNTTSDNVVVVGGQLDSISQVGLGVGFESTRHRRRGDRRTGNRTRTIGSRKVYEAIRDRLNIQLRLVGHAGHTFKSLHQNNGLALN